MARGQNKQSWVKWLAGYGLAKFYDAFLHNAQGAESTCIYCEEPIYLDIVEGGGVPDWCTKDGDYGCVSSPETTKDGTGGHFPRRSQRLVQLDKLDDPDGSKFRYDKNNHTEDCKYRLGLGSCNCPAGKQKAAKASKQ